VLIAEDEFLLAGVVTDLVRLHGGTVVGPVSTERDARKLIDELPVDIAVLDVMLSGGPCFALAEELTERGVPVILTTGQAMSRIPRSLSGLSVFSKPLKVAPLVDRIAELCGRARTKAS